MPIASGSVIRDVTLLIRNLISGAGLDPVSGARANVSGARFVMTNFPERNVVYPMITVEARKQAAEKLGSNSQSMKVPVTVTTRTWSKSKGQADQLADAVFRVLQTSQSGGALSTEGNGLYGFTGLAEVDVDDPGKEGIHSKVSEFGYYVLV